MEPNVHHLPKYLYTCNLLQECIFGIAHSNHYLLRGSRQLTFIPINGQFAATSDALCNLCLRLFNFTIIFHDDKTDENKVIGN